MADRGGLRQEKPRKSQENGGLQKAWPKRKAKQREGQISKSQMSESTRCHQSLGGSWRCSQWQLLYIAHTAHTRMALPGCRSRDGDGIASPAHLAGRAIHSTRWLSPPGNREGLWGGRRDRGIVLLMAWQGMAGHGNLPWQAWTGRLLSGGLHALDSASHFFGFFLPTSSQPPQVPPKAPRFPLPRADLHCPASASAAQQAQVLGRRMLSFTSPLGEKSCQTIALVSHSVCLLLFSFSGNT